MQQSMILINGVWGEKKTFKLIPGTPNSPYNEGIYDPDAGILAMISKEKKQSMHMVARLDDLGDPKKVSRKRAGGKDYAEERKLLDSYYEYYVDNPDDIRQLVKLIAMNADSFDIEPFLVPAEEGKLVSL